MASIVVNSISLPKHCSIYICAPQLSGADCFMQHFLGLIKAKLTKKMHAKDQCSALSNLVGR